jgi:hypothetical protein
VAGAHLLQREVDLLPPWAVRKRSAGLELGVVRAYGVTLWRWALGADL